MNATTKEAVLYREIVRAAAMTLGGEAQLAERLQVDFQTVRRWTEGDDTPPLAYFMEALEAIAEAPWRAAPHPTKVGIRESAKAR